MRALPRNVVVRDGRYYFRRKRRGRDCYTRLPHLDDASFADALSLARIKPSISPLIAASVRKWRNRAQGYATGEQLPTGVIVAAREARKRAARRGLPFSLTLDQIMVLWKRSGGSCELTGLAFDQKRTHHRWRPFAVSLDRIDCSAGYDFANVRLVCVAVNAALNQWGDDVFWTVVNAAARRLRGDADPSRGDEAENGT